MDESVVTSVVVADSPVDWLAVEDSVVVAVSVVVSVDNSVVADASVVVSVEDSVVLVVVPRRISAYDGPVLGVVLGLVVGDLVVVVVDVVIADL